MNMADEKTPNDLAHDAADRLSDKLWPHRWPVPHPWLSAIGVGATSDGKPLIYVYTRRKLTAAQAALVPAEWEGFAVTSKVMGDMRLC